MRKGIRKGTLLVWTHTDDPYDTTVSVVDLARVAGLRAVPHEPWVSPGDELWVTLDFWVGVGSPQPITMRHVPVAEAKRLLQDTPWVLAVQDMAEGTKKGPPPSGNGPDTDKK